MHPQCWCNLNKYFVVVLNDQAKVDNKEMFGGLWPFLQGFNSGTFSRNKSFPGLQYGTHVCQYFTV